MTNESDHNEWWRGAVMYQIYPRSYADSNNDGIGDLKGITEKLEYVADLGVDGIWISPFFKSPMKDFGYDVSDYRDVDPIFGSLADFRTLLDKAHDLGLKIIIDLVLNHSSDQHPWFQESRQSRDNSKADWYVWADPKADGSPPNNWLSCFGTGAWTYEIRRGQYYLHNFLKEQPDLNFHNPDVQDAVLAEAKFWLDFGIDGFRMDVVNFYFHDKGLRNNPPRENTKTEYATQFEGPDLYNMQEHIYNKSQPENIEFLKKFRKLMNQYPGTMTLGEVGDDDLHKIASEYTNGDELLNTAYNTHMMTGISKELSAKLIDEPIKNFLKQNGDGWPSWAFSNHDVVRTVSRWGTENNLEKSPEFAKMLIALLCSIRGTAFIYQGEELGLPETDIPFEQLQDPWGIFLYPLWQGRDGCRTPMPWNDGEVNAGFGTEDPWLPIPDSHVKLAVNAQESNTESTLSFTRSFLKWRKSMLPLITGDISFLDTKDEMVIGFTRVADEQTILCLFNLGGEEKHIELPMELKNEDPFDAGKQTGSWDNDKKVAKLPPLGILLAF